MLGMIIGIVVFCLIIIALIETLIWAVMFAVGVFVFSLGVLCIQAGFDQSNYLMFVPAAVIFYLVYLGIMANADND